MLFEPYIIIRFIFKFGLLNGCLLGNSCSLGLRYVYSNDPSDVRFDNHIVLIRLKNCSPWTNIKPFILVGWGRSLAHDAWPMMIH